MPTTMTARRLITNALRTLNVIATGEVPSATEAEDSLEVLNEMVESWNTEDLMIYNVPRVVQQFQAGKGLYTLGPGGDWEMERPNKIESLYWRRPLDDLELPIRMQTAQEHRHIPIKSITSTIPTWGYVIYDFPLATIQFWPVPSESQECVIYPWARLTTAANLDTVFALPDGYARAMRFNLAVELSSEFPSVLAPEEWARLNGTALESKATIERVNYKGEVLVMDGFLTQPRAYDWRTDERR